MGTSLANSLWEFWGILWDSVGFCDILKILVDCGGILGILRVEEGERGAIGILGDYGDSVGFWGFWWTLWILGDSERVF